MSNIDKQALRKAAEKAGADEWRAFIDTKSKTYAVHTPGDNRCGDVVKWAGFDGQQKAANKARFIAAANPSTVLALLDELEAAEKRVAELSSSVIAPGKMRCAGCGFVLTKNNINMNAGTITAGDSKTEPCPNGCGPLWPVTWKEQAIEMRDSSEQWFEELQEARQRIAELQASHNNLREAMAGIHNTIAGGRAYTPLAAILNASKRAYEESAAAAGKGE